MTGGANRVVVVSGGAAGTFEGFTVDDPGAIGPGVDSSEVVSWPVG